MSFVFSIVVGVPRIVSHRQMHVLSLWVPADEVSPLLLFFHPFRLNSGCLYAHAQPRNLLLIRLHPVCLLFTPQQGQHLNHLQEMWSIRETVWQAIRLRTLLPTGCFHREQMPKVCNFTSFDCSSSNFVSIQFFHYQLHLVCCCQCLSVKRCLFVMKRDRVMRALCRLGRHIPDKRVLRRTLPKNTTAQQR